MPEPRTPDEVEKLADTLFRRHAEWPVTGALVSADELRTLARAASAVGARTALENAPHDHLCWLITSKRPVAKFCNCWKRRALATYTTDEETTA